MTTESDPLLAPRPGHIVGICCIPGIVLSLPLGVHRPLGRWTHGTLPASGLGVCQEGHASGLRHNEAPHRQVMAVGSLGVRFGGH